MFGVDEVIGQIMIPDERDKATTAAGNNIDLLRAIDSIYTGKTMLVREMSPDDFVARIPVNGKIVDDAGKELTDKDGALLPLKDGDRDITYYKSKLLEKFINMNLLTKAPPDLISNLHHKIILKDTVGQFVWFLLIGSLTVLISTNTLLNSGCTTKNGNYNTIFNS